MLKSLLLTSTLLGAAVYSEAHAAMEPASSWWHVQALNVLALALPERACALDQVACLQRQDEKLAKLGGEANATLRELVERQRANATNVTEAQKRAGDNDMLLNQGRALWQNQGSLGRPVTWVGVAYQPAEFRAQIESLYRERNPLQQSVEQLRKVSSELNDRAVGMAAVRDKIVADRATLSAKLSSARVGALTGALTATLAEADRIVSTANAEFAEAQNATSRTLRTTDELTNDATKIEKPAIPGFDDFLAGGRSQ